MVTLQELSQHIDQLLSCPTFADYQPNGIQVEGVGEIKKIATAVSASLEAIDRACDLGVDALIVHHGMFWTGDPYPIVGIKRKKLEKLLSHSISLLAYHLPLDAHNPLGNNFGAASALGLHTLQPFLIKGTPLGVVGEVPSLSVSAFKERLEAFYGHSALAAPFGKARIETVGIISGGAHKMIDQAIALQLDAFVTGSFDEPVWHAAKEAKINFFALGHAATERIGPKLLGEYLARTFGLETCFIEDDNPM